MQAVDGVDAMKKLGDTTVNMMITDLNMPNMDGIELMKTVLTIELVGQDMGGTDIRKVYFHTDTGIAYLKRLPSAMFYEIAEKGKRGIKIITKRMERVRKAEWL